MKILWIAFIASVSGFLSISAEDKIAPRKCCGSGNNLLLDNKCVPEKNGKSSQISLQCKEKFVLDPALFEDDAYNITDDGSLLVLDLKSSISPDE